MAKSVSKEVAESWAYTNTKHNVRRFSQNRPAKKGDNKGKVKIEIEVLSYTYGGTNQYHRERLLIDTTIWVDKGNWSNKTQKLSKKESDYDYKSNKIDAVYSTVLSYINSKGQIDLDQAYIEGVDYGNLREVFPNRKENRKTFDDLFIDFKNYRATDNETAESTVKRIGTVAISIKNFDTYRGRKTYIEDISFIWSDNYNQWMVQEKEYKPATIHRNYEILKNCLRYYWKRRDELQLEMNNKFEDPDFGYGKKAANAPHALSIEQREILFNHKFKKPYLEKARKMMCIQAFTGCRYSDIKLFAPANFKQSGKLIYTPKKTKRWDIEVVQPLNPNAEAIFKEVNYYTGEEYKTSHQKYNPYIIDVFEALKEEFPDAKFTADYTSHNMRDTFISICVKSGVNFKSILKWSGLTKYETLDHYIDLDDEFEKKEMEKTVLE
jgi:site-specific recombinase XerD